MGRIRKYVMEDTEKRELIAQTIGSKEDFKFIFGLEG